MCCLKAIFLCLIVVVKIQFCKPTSPTESPSDKSILLDFPDDTLQLILIGKRINNLKRGDIKGFKNLFDIELCNNKIENIEPGTFDILPKLERMNLSENSLTKVENGVFNNLNIRILDLSWNKISVIEETALNDMPELTSLYLGNNEITKWNPNWFQRTPKLIRLVFEHNNLNSLPENAFQNIESTRTDNKTDMCWLDFSYNQITELHPKTFAGVKYAEGINFKNNSISDLPPGLFSSLEKTSLIWFWYNQITCLSDEFLESLPPTLSDNIELDFNPWNCSCVEKSHDWSKAHGKTLSVLITYFDCVVDPLLKDGDAE
ncbi:leucine-rich repeat-containing protein 15-like [Agrilus planipennis]|uniref:Leucine-rich repeat-containing protein 15-like n=1 Tax=Agrilus planipennis TaxID=224129 RepID=A0A1W4WJ05_AGRPL|nr:leucine-rich repeat-containing protein 15-like [Agrilus planipennis]